MNIFLANLSDTLVWLSEFSVLRAEEEMGGGNQEAVKQLQTLMENVDDEQLKNTFQIMHQGYQTETLIRFLKARDWNIAKAHKMFELVQLIDCLNWRVENEIDNVLRKPIPMDLYRAIRDSQLIGMSGYSKEGLPVIAVGVGLSTYDKASDKYYIQSHIQLNEYRDQVILPTATRKHGRYIGTCVKVLDMTGLKFSALNQLRLLTAISTIDDLNYPEKTDTYYIVNVPYVFSACWKVVKPLLQERTRRKIQVLQGCGKEELLKVMDYASLPHFCRKEDSKSSKYHALGNIGNCFSFNHAFHQQLYNHIKQQSIIVESISPIRQGSFYVDIPEPDPDDAKIAKTIETEFHKLENQKNGFTNSLNGLRIGFSYTQRMIQMGGFGFDPSKAISAEKDNLDITQHDWALPNFEQLAEAVLRQVGLPVIAVGVGLSTYDKASEKYCIQSHIQLNEYRDQVILPTATRKHGQYIGTTVKVLDMTGLKFSALNQLRLLTALSTIDDLNYPEKTDTYYIVNVPYVFSACWKVVKPLLQERTWRNIQVLQGCGKEELLKTCLTICEGHDGTETSNGDVLIFPDMIRYRRLTHFDVETFVEEVLVKEGEWLPGNPESLKASYVFVCSHGSRDRRCGVFGPILVSRFREEIELHGLQGKVLISSCSHIGGNKYAGNVIIFGSSNNREVTGHLYGYVTPDDSISPIRQGSFYVDIPEPDPDDAKIAKTIETEFHKLENQKNGFTNSLNGLRIGFSYTQRMIQMGGFGFDPSKAISAEKDNLDITQHDWALPNFEQLAEAVLRQVGLPVIAVGVGLSTYDKASEKYCIQSHIQLNEYRDQVILPTATRKHGQYIGTTVKVLDMTGLKFSALNQLRLLTALSTIDDLNYPEKTDTYYIVNVPYVFSACWKVVKPLLQERTWRNIQVLQGCGKEELLKVMDYASLPHFCTKEDSKSSKHHALGNTENCFSFNHAFHQQLYNHIKQQSIIVESISPIRQGSFYVDITEPDLDDAKIAKTIETEFHKLENQKNGFTNSLNGLRRFKKTKTLKEEIPITKHHGKLDKNTCQGKLSHKKEAPKIYRHNEESKKREQHPNKDQLPCSIA
ncbi:SEC14 cytosolic factor [Glycine soja]